MRKIFWSVIFVIFFLVLVSLVFYSGEEEIVAEPLPEEITVLIGEMRDTIDQMDLDFQKMNEMMALALAAGNTANGKNWIVEAEGVQASILNTFNTKISQLKQTLDNSGLNESAQKQVNEFFARAKGLISNDYRRDILAAKNKVGLRATSNEWQALAEMYRNMPDKFERNMGLRALAEVVVVYNSSLANSIFEQMDSPYVIEQLAISNPNFTSPEGNADNISDPYLKLQVLISKGMNGINAELVNELNSVLNMFSDEKEKAFMAARVLYKLPKLPASSHGVFLDFVGSEDILLLTDTKMCMIENGAVSGSDKESFLADIDAIVEEIPQNYPREKILTRSIKQKIGHPLDELLEMVHELESVTLREEVLIFIALNKENLSGEEYDRVIDTMEEPYSKLVSKIIQFKELDPAGKEAEDFLNSLGGFSQEVSEPRPLIELTSLWIKVNSLQARQMLSSLDTKTKAEALTEFVKNADSSVLTIVLNDLYTEVQNSTQFENIERSELLRKIAVAMKSVDRARSNSILEEAFNIIKG
ncbi:hypothetical protein ACFL7D_08835 [candidate division KSB1 bacterium]